MSTIFNYTEFIQLTNKGKINYEKLTLSKNTTIASATEYFDDFVYLIVEGFVVTSLVQTPSTVYTVCSEGAFLNYYALLDTKMPLFVFKTASKCIIYKYSMKDLEYLLSMFPENYGFQFFIMKDLATHLYFKTLLTSGAGVDRVKTSFANIAKLHGIPFEIDKVIIPKEISTQIILSYSGLSRSTSYEQLAPLKKSGKINKVNKQWIIQDQSIYDYCQKRVNLNI